MTPGAMPERHREFTPFAGLTGNVRSATGAQGRSRKPCRRAEARHCTADQSQRVSAKGGELERRFRRVGVVRCLDQAREEGRTKGFTLSKVLEAPVVEPPETTSPLGAVDVQGMSSQVRVEREGGDRRHGQATGHAAIKKTAKRQEPQAPKAPR